MKIIKKKKDDIWQGLFDFDGDGQTSPEEEWVGIKFIESLGSMSSEKDKIDLEIKNKTNKKNP